MTSEQKNQIVLMHNQGYGYKKIAACLNVSPNTVKSWLKRLNMTADECHEITTDENYCKGCGQPIMQISGRKKMLFCCRDCRQKWWNAHLDQVRRKAIYSFTCLHCGKEFTAYGNNHRKYCSRKCYIDERFHQSGK